MRNGPIFIAIFVVALGACFFFYQSNGSSQSVATTKSHGQNAAQQNSGSMNSPNGLPVLSTSPSIPKVSVGPIISFNFDDGFQSAYQNALPIFNAAGFPTTQYIITGSIGTKNYVTAQEVLTMQSEGHEIGAHTRTHPHLAQLSLAQAQSEILGSKQDLRALGISSVTTFAYPYGNEDPTIENLVKQDGFTGARITKPGLNDALTDPYALWYFNVAASTTLPQVESVIDQDVLKKKWLILVFHMVDEPGNNWENVSRALVQKIVNYVKSKHVHVVTNAEGLHLLPVIP